MWPQVEASGSAAARGALARHTVTAAAGHPVMPMERAYARWQVIRVKAWSHRCAACKSSVADLSSDARLTPTAAAKTR